MSITTPYLSLTGFNPGQLNWGDSNNSNYTRIDDFAQNVTASLASLSASITATATPFSLNGSTGSVVLTGGSNITLSQNLSTITINASFSQSVQSQGIQGVSLSGNTSGVMTLVSSGTVFLIGGSNITLSQSQNSVVIIGTSGGGGGGTFSAGISGGNTSGDTGTVTNQMVLAGGNNITLSGSTDGGGLSVTISGPNTVAQSIQTQGMVSINGSTGNISFVGSGAVSLSQNASTITISGSSQSVQSVGVYASSQTTGQSSSSTVDARSLSIAGQGIVSVGLSGGSVLISATTPSQTAQSVGLYASSQTYAQSSSSTVDARSLSVVGQGAISVGLSAGSLMLSVAPGAQSAQTVGIYASSQTYGQSSSSTIDARSLSVVAQGLISAGLSAGSLVLSASSAAQTVQTIGVYNSSQTVGQSSSSTVDARSFTHVGQGIVSVGMSGGSLLISATTVAQTNQSIGVYASSQTVGQSSSSTVDARSFTHVGQGIVSVGMSGGSLLISATTAQSVQSLGLYASSQTVGQSSSSTFDARSVSFVGQGAVSVGASGGSFLISAPNTVAQTNQTVGVYASSQTYGQSSSSTVDARSVSFVGQGLVSVGMSGGSVVLSASSAAQTAQTLGIYGSSQTVGQSSSSTVDARSFTHVGQGIVSVGMSAGSLLISATTPSQTNQTIGLYASSQTTAQSSSSTVDARSLSIVGMGIASVGLSGGSFIVSVPSGGGAGDGVNIVSMMTSTAGGGTAGATFSTISGSIGLQAGSQMTLSQTSNTIVLQGPPYGSLNFNAGNQISLSSSSNGVSTTLTISHVRPTMSYWNNVGAGSGVNLQSVQRSADTRSLFVFPLNPELGEFWPADITVSTARMFVTASASTASITQQHSFGVSLGIYTISGSSLSLLNSVGSTYSNTTLATSDASNSYIGPRWITFHSSQWSSSPVFTQGGRYFGALIFSWSSISFNTFGIYGETRGSNFNHSGTWGAASASNTSRGLFGFVGNYTATTAAFPGSIANSELRKTIADAPWVPYLEFDNILSVH